MIYFSILSILSFFSATGDLNIQIQNIMNTEGSIRLAVFDSERSFLIDEKAFFAKEYLITKKGAVDITIPNLPFGKYAIAVYHDENANQKLDKNLFGVPTEAYGFSNKARSKWRAPKFKEGQFEFSSDQEKISISLEKWTKQ